MAATNAVLAFGGMTQHCRRWGWRTFFLASFRSLSRWHDRQSSVPRPFSPTAAGSSARVTWAAWNKPAQSVWLPSSIKNPSNPRCRLLLATQHSLEAFLRQLLSHPVNHGNAGVQSLDDPAVTPTCTGFRGIGLQQYSRLQQPLRRALAFPYQRFKLFALLAAQPNNILLYRNLLGSHDCLHRPRCNEIESQNPSPFKYSN